jgi:hypothetical protein
MKLLTVAVVAGSVLALAGIIWWDWSVFSAIGFAMPAVGWVAMGIGVVLTIAVGCGLMFLIFYSNRHGYDDAVGRQDGHGDDQTWERSD